MFDIVYLNDGATDISYSMPAYMDAVERILRNGCNLLPADSRGTFLRSFQVQEFVASVAFSRSNIVYGCIATGSIKNGSGSGPSILNNCLIANKGHLFKGYQCHAKACRKVS